MIENKKGVKGCYRKWKGNERDVIGEKNERDVIEVRWKETKGVL